MNLKRSAGLFAAGFVSGAVSLAGLALATPVSHATPSPSITVSRYGVVQSNTLPHCKWEDGSGGPRPCTDSGTNSHGFDLTYWVGVHMHVHYVWPSRPLGLPVMRRPALVDALAEGDRQRWRKCWLDENHTHVACPNGHVVRVYGQR